MKYGRLKMMEVVGEGGSRRWEDGWEHSGWQRALAPPAAPRMRVRALGKGWGWPLLYIPIQGPS